MKTQDLKSVEEIDLLECDPAHKEIGCALCMALRLLRQSLFDGVSVLTRTLRSLMFTPCSSQHRPPPQFALLPSANAQSVRTYAFLEMPARLYSKLGNIIAKAPPLLCHSRHTLSLSQPLLSQVFFLPHLHCHTPILLLLRVHVCVDGFPP